MSLLRIKTWFIGGVQKLRWYASLLSERIHVELALIKLLNDIETVEKKKGDVVLRIGERVLEFKDSPNYDVLTDAEIKSLLHKVESLNEEIRSLKKKADELSKLEG
jgi:hypothetical protein